MCIIFCSKVFACLHCCFVVFISCLHSLFAFVFAYLPACCCALFACARCLHLCLHVFVCFVALIVCARCLHVCQYFVCVVYIMCLHSLLAYVFECLLVAYFALCVCTRCLHYDVTLCLHCCLHVCVHAYFPMLCALCVRYLLVCVPCI